MFRRYIVRFFFAIAASIFIGSAGGTALAQSSNQNFPTPVTENELDGTIPSRAIGDSRLTTYYYVFDSDVGDMFINVSTKNFSGDVDIFADNGARSMTKIVVYADLAENETGRVIYLRKPERLIMRIQGRSPGDDPASFRIKFAGSFVAAKESDTQAEPELPKVTAKNETGVRVNSVGTIIEVVPKTKRTEKPPAPPIKQTESKAEKTQAPVVEPEVAKETSTETAKKEEEIPAVKKPAKAVRPARPVETTTARTAPPKRTPPVRKPAKKADEPAKSEAPAADPLASIHLLIEFKDGSTIERPMNEVFKFSVDKGVLTVISKDGTIGRYSILEVEKVTIQ